MYSIGSLLHYRLDSFVNQEELKEVKCQKGDLFLVIKSDNLQVCLVHQITLYSTYWMINTLDRYFEATI